LQSTNALKTPVRNDGGQQWAVPTVPTLIKVLERYKNLHKPFQISFYIIFCHYINFYSPCFFICQLFILLPSPNIFKFHIFLFILHSFLFHAFSVLFSAPILTSSILISSDFSTITFCLYLFTFTSSAFQSISYCEWMPRPKHLIEIPLTSIQYLVLSCWLISTSMSYQTINRSKRKRKQIKTYKILQRLFLHHFTITNLFLAGNSVGQCFTAKSISTRWLRNPKTNLND
jgi:hypothetical protein